MEYTLNNFIGDTLYVLERQNFGTLEFDIPRINSLSYEEAYKFRNTYYIDDMEGEFEADFIGTAPFCVKFLRGLKSSLSEISKQNIAIFEELKARHYEHLSSFDKLKAFSL